jgi:hypothetical protein
MVDVRLGGQVSQSAQTDKTKEAEKLDKKQAVKERENMAGAQQVETKHKKEEVTKTEGRFKAYKTAYEYLLGEEPEKPHVEEDMRSAPVEEEEDNVKVKKPTPEEIEEYNVRGRFKAKVALLLGEDFDEDKPYEEENIIVPEIRYEDSKQKVELARHSYQTLVQYINSTIGRFDFDRIDDIKMFLDYGMPEDAILKFIFLQQMARSGVEFPNVLDISVIMYKLKKLEIEKTDEQIIDLIKTDYETLTKLKYTVAGFVYVPLLEVMEKIEEDLKKNYPGELFNLLKKFNIDEIPDLNHALAKTIIFSSLKELVKTKQKEIVEIGKEKMYTNLKLGQTKVAKAKAELQEKINLLSLQTGPLETELSRIELEVARIILLFTFLTSQQSIADFNRKFPVDELNSTLKGLLVRPEKKEIIDFLQQKISVHCLELPEKINKEPLKKSIETFETKIKGADLTVTKLPPPKQQQMLKSIRNNDFDINANFYWLRQKNLGNILEYCEQIVENFNE